MVKLELKVRDSRRLTAELAEIGESTWGILSAGSALSAVN
jgi:hypothetical protein